MAFAFGSTVQKPAAANGLETKLQELKARAERARTEHARAEAQLESIAKQREEALAELAQLGVTEETLDQAIAELDAEIQRAMAEAEQLLNPTAATTTASTNEELPF